MNWRMDRLLKAGVFKGRKEGWRTFASPQRGYEPIQPSLGKLGLSSARHYCIFLGGSDYTVSQQLLSEMSDAAHEGAVILCPGGDVVDQIIDRATG
jgi:hypothetical protein